MGGGATLKEASFKGIHFTCFLANQPSLNLKTEPKHKTNSPTSWALRTPNKLVISCVHKNNTYHAAIILLKVFN